MASRHGVSTNFPKITKTALWALIFVFGIVVVSSQVSAFSTSCTLTTDRSSGLYHPAETMLWTMQCSQNRDTAVPFILNVYNSTNGLVTQLNGTTSSSTGVFFYTTWSIPSTYLSQNNSYGVMTVPGDTGNSTAYFNVSGSPADSYVVVQTSSTYNGDWYWNENNAVRGVVKNYLGTPVVGALCKLDIYNSIDNGIFYTQSSTNSGADGDVAFNVYVDYNTFDIATYKYEVGCQYNPQLTLDPTNQTHYAAGQGVGVFTISPYVSNVTAYLQSGLSTQSTETQDATCVSFTNNYRDYSEGYTINYQLLCNQPSQNVVLTGQESHLVEPNANVTYCYQFTLPEIAAGGTGNCQIFAGITVYEGKDDFSSDFSSVSSSFNITPTFPISYLPTYWTSSGGHLLAMYNTSRAYSVNDTIRIDISSVIINSYALDAFLNGTVSYNGSNMSCVVGTGTVSPLDHRVDGITAPTTPDVIVGTVSVRNDELHCVVTATIPKGVIITLTTNWASPTSFWQQLIAGIQSIAFSISRIAGFANNGAGNIAVATVGNYTNVTGSLTTSTVGVANLTVNYNITSNNNLTRRNLHFVYEFAPIVSGNEGAFVDQNPSIEGYQSLGVFQAMTLNQTKSLSLTLSPNLAPNSYTMYETIYEVNSAQQDKSGNVLSDERLISQNTYSITVTAQMTPSFNGNVVRFDGVSMTSIS